MNERKYSHHKKNRTEHAKNHNNTQKIYDESSTIIESCSSIPFDVIDVVVENIKDPKTFKNVLLTCKYLNKTHSHKVDKYCNVLWTLINKYAEGKWDRANVLGNPNTTLNMFKGSLKHEMLSGNFWSYISSNPSVTLDFIEANIKKRWCWYALSSNKNLTIEFVYNHPNKPWNNSLISQHKNITIDDINTYWIPYMHVHMYMFKNPNLTIEFVKTNGREWHHWTDISQNPGISQQDIIDNIELPWDWKYVSHNPNITPTFIESYIDKNWDWDAIYRTNPYLTLEFIEKHHYIDKGHKVEMWISLSFNKHITIDILRKHADKPWRWDELFKTSPYYEELIEKHLVETRVWAQQEAVWSKIFANPHITLSFCEKHINKLHAYGWNSIYKNTFGIV